MKQQEATASDRRKSMATPGFDRENILGRKLTKMDRQEL